MQLQRRFIALLNENENAPCSLSELLILCCENLVYFLTSVTRMYTCILFWNYIYIYGFAFGHVQFTVTDYISKKGPQKPAQGFLMDLCFFSR